MRGLKAAQLGIKRLFHPNLVLSKFRYKASFRLIKQVHKKDVFLLGKIKFPAKRSDTKAKLC